MLSAKQIDKLPLYKRRLYLRNHPDKGVTEHYKQIYNTKSIKIGSITKEKRGDEHLARKNTAVIIGAQQGDEGKGRIIDNKIQDFFSRPGIKKVFVIRFNGGNNAGHTVQKGKIKLALHVVPSGIFYSKTNLILDRGMILHTGDLRAEIEYIEKATARILTSKRMSISEEAAHCTDLERAEEVFYKEITEKAKGGTGRGIAPTAAHEIDRTGKSIYDLMQDNWEENYGRYYNLRNKQFKAYGKNLAEYLIPDYPKSLKTGNVETRIVGSKTNFLNQLRRERTWLIKRNYITNTRPIYEQFYDDPSAAFIFEGAQGISLDTKIGTYPDVTSTQTTVYGLVPGTAFWKPEDIAERYAVTKGTYESSVGVRKPLTLVPLPKDLKELSKNPPKEQQWAAWIRIFANEYGTTTKRPRDILHVDLARLTFNLNMAGVNSIIATHMDVARKNESILVCTHYTDKKGETVLYQPGIRYQQGLIPKYVELPGWDGQLCSNAKTTEQLPENCLKFLAFIQKRTGYPIVAISTGPARSHFLNFP